MTLSELIDVLTIMKDSSGETDGLTELDHGLQCAHNLATIRPDDIELQVAGLVHDIGQRFGSDVAHGHVGAELVRDALGERVAALVEAHVPAKRFLVTTDPSYRDALSAVSTTSLEIQGGTLSPEQVAAFSSSPHAVDAVALRRADDDAKVAGRVIPSLAYWIPLLGRLDS